MTAPAFVCSRTQPRASLSLTRPRPSFAQGYGPSFCSRRAYRCTTYLWWNLCSRIGIIASIVAVPIVFVIQIVSRSILMQFTSGKEHLYTILMRRDSNQERRLHARYCSAVFRPLSTLSSWKLTLYSLLLLSDAFISCCQGIQCYSAPCACLTMPTIYFSGVRNSHFQGPQHFSFRSNTLFPLDSFDIATIHLTCTSSFPYVLGQSKRKGGVQYLHLHLPLSDREIQVLSTINHPTFPMSVEHSSGTTNLIE
jgi:hypothetical protein